MKIITTALILLIFGSVCSCASAELNLSRMTHIGVWDLKASDLNEQEKRITSPESVGEIVRILTSEKLKWNKVITTAATGDTRLIFYANDGLTEALGIGEGFIVRGTGGNWQVAKISKQFEIKLRKAVQTALNNMSNHSFHFIADSVGSK